MTFVERGGDMFIEKVHACVGDLHRGASIFIDKVCVHDLHRDGQVYIY